MQTTWPCFLLLGDDIHDIFALINGKIVSFLVQIMQIISAYLLPHPLPSQPNSYPAKQPPLIPTGWERTGQMLCIVDTSLSILMTLRMCLRELCRLFTVWI